MDLSSLDTAARAQVAAFLALPSRLDTAASSLAALARTPGLPQATASTVSNAIDNVTQVRAQYVAVNAKLSPLVSSLSSAGDVLSQIGIGAAIAAQIPDVASVMARTTDIESTIASVRQQVAGMGLQVPSAVPASAWIVGAGLAALALFAYKRR